MTHARVDHRAIAIPYSPAEPVGVRQPRRRRAGFTRGGACLVQRTRRPRSLGWRRWVMRKLCVSRGRQYAHPARHRTRRLVVRPNAILRLDRVLPNSVCKRRRNNPSRMKRPETFGAPGRRAGHDPIWTFESTCGESADGVHLSLPIALRSSILKGSNVKRQDGVPR